MKLALLLAAMMLSGCDTVDRGACLTSHVEEYTWLIPLYAGSTPCGNGCSMPIYTYIPQTGTQLVCDHWEFPEGRKP